MPSLVAPDDVEAIIASGLSAAALQGVIDREEAWLARRIGPLTGERTQRMWPPAGDTGPLWLQRATEVVVVESGGVTVDALLIGDARVELRSGAWYGPVDATYTPTDEPEVARVLIELVRMAVTASPYVSEDSTGGESPAHGSRRAGSQQQMRDALARELMPHRGHTTLTIATTDSVAR